MALCKNLEFANYQSKKLLSGDANAAERNATSQEKDQKI